MPKSKKSEIGEDVFLVEVEALELVTASGKPLPYPAWIGTVDVRACTVSVWRPAGYRPHGYVAAAEKLLRGELARLRAELFS